MARRAAGVSMRVQEGDVVIEVLTPRKPRAGRLRGEVAGRSVTV
jgi:hypothetical protein